MWLIQGNLKWRKSIKKSLEMNRKSQNKHDIAFSLDTMGNIMTETSNLELAGVSGRVLNFKRNRR